MSTPLGVDDGREVAGRGLLTPSPLCSVGVLPVIGLVASTEEGRVELRLHVEA